MSRILGIDPGLTGAITLMIPAAAGAVYADIRDMPTVELQRGGKAKNQVSPQLLTKLILNLGSSSGADITGAFIEQVGAMRGQGVTSMFSFGRSLGIVEGVLAALDIPISYVTPQTWQKFCGVGKGDDAGRARALQLYPTLAEQLARKKDHGRADSLLIAHYGFFNR